MDIRSKKLRLSALLASLIVASTACSHVDRQCFALGYWGEGEEPRSIELSFACERRRVILFDNAFESSRVARIDAETFAQAEASFASLERCLQERPRSFPEGPILLVSYDEYQRQYRIIPGFIPRCAVEQIEWIDHLGAQLFPGFNGLPGIKSTR
jgi:hypothetical protein